MRRLLAVALPYSFTSTLAAITSQLETEAGESAVAGKTSGCGALTVGAILRMTHQVSGGWSVEGLLLMLRSTIVLAWMFVCLAVSGCGSNQAGLQTRDDGAISAASSPRPSDTPPSSAIVIASSGVDLSLTPVESDPVTSTTPQEPRILPGFDTTTTPPMTTTVVAAASVSGTAVPDRVVDYRPGGNGYTDPPCDTPEGCAEVVEGISPAPCTDSNDTENLEDEYRAPPGFVLAPGKTAAVLVPGKQTWVRSSWLDVDTEQPLSYDTSNDVTTVLVTGVQTPYPVDLCIGSPGITYRISVGSSYVTVYPNSPSPGELAPVENVVR
jgi:hypothetical protein